jgi:GTPase
MTMPPYILLFGRPNVGKSTLYNRLLGKNHAIVHDASGVTRDIRETICGDPARPYILADSPGWTDLDDQAWLKQQRILLERALGRADLVLLVADAKVGITHTDKEMAQMARATGKQVIILANKCEGQDEAVIIAEMAGLGFEHIIPVSALHGLGVGEIEDYIEPYLAAPLGQPSENEENKPALPLRLAIMGRPNVGKSTLVNTLLGEERVLTGDMPHLTRDAITIDWQWRDKAIRLIDTAGLRRKARVESSLEQATVHETRHALMFAEVVVLVIDGVTGVDKQDLSLAKLIADEGRAIVIAVNKMDRVDKPDLEEIEHRLSYSLTQLKGVPVIPITAATGKGTDALLEAVFQQYEIWQTDIGTGKLNAWLGMATSQHPPPRATSGVVKIRYATQNKRRPPCFMLFVNRPKDLSKSYIQYLENSLRQHFNLYGIPLRFVIRGGENPYVKD